ncbi:hypothetical protein SAHL_17425 [Salinisphaera orenii YIM 95161]|uniref:Aldehyde oxidase/xanthine dehydrogenase a/b hammerhead domain-containing protein n=1 Tax=Salinisphaera orenii YIM 95161 TaxID=1051139 RepID=A0A423PDF4_9GAMM|nr:hypothetical protein [Salinisphaera halophila]ROO22391.1 hypothetical protein SAHL_17425 [Salinisphaera halophila YIM 95161]
MNTEVSLRDEQSCSLIGKRQARVEDEALLRGLGRYADLVVPPGTLHVAIVRSPHAHARLKRVAIESALGMPGVLIGEDVRRWAAPFAVGMRQPVYARLQSSPNHQ